MSLLQMSISAGIMIIVVLVIRALAINLLPKKMFLVLWGIVLVRLLIPFSCQSPLSVYSFISHSGASQMKTAAAADILPLSPSVDAAAETNAGLSPWVYVWAIGAALCALYFMAAYFKCHWEFMKFQPVKNDFTDEWLKKHKCRRDIIIGQARGVSTPLTYDIFRPVILLPVQTDWTDSDSLRYVLTHEYVHIRRFDGVTKFLLIAVLCIHWFNPMIWAMFVLANRDIELSCDETVIQLFGEKSKSAYALTLISMEEKKNRFTPLCSDFSKNAIEERIKAIMKYKRRSALTTIIAIFLLLGFMATLATSAATEKPVLLQGNTSGQIRTLLKHSIICWLIIRVVRH